MTWELIWKLCFILVITAFLAMAILTSILGARDIRKLLRSLRHDDEVE